MYLFFARGNTIGAVFRQCCRGERVHLSRALLRVGIGNVVFLVRAVGYLEFLGPVAAFPFLLLIVAHGSLTKASLLSKFCPTVCRL